MFHFSATNLCHLTNLYFHKTYKTGSHHLIKISKHSCQTTKSSISKNITILVQYILGIIKYNIRIQLKRNEESAKNEFNKSAQKWLLLLTHFHRSGTNLY